MRNLLLSLILTLNVAHADGLWEQFGIDGDFYIVDLNQDGKASIDTLEAGSDRALVLMHQPDLLDIIQANPYGQESAVLLRGNTLTQQDLNQDGLIDAADIGYSSLGLLSFDKTGKATLVPLTQSQMYISLYEPWRFKSRAMLVDKQGKTYPLVHYGSKS
jgi:hypothetical protein